MNSLTYNLAHYPRSSVRFMGFAWVVIGLKCAVVWWAMVHWQVPFHPLWVVGPTLIFATLVTTLWLTHHED